MYLINYTSKPSRKIRYYTKQKLNDKIEAKRIIWEEINQDVDFYDLDELTGL